jgi:hypothetical protein
VESGARELTSITALRIEDKQTGGEEQCAFHGAVLSDGCPFLYSYARLKHDSYRPADSS